MSTQVINSREVLIKYAYFFINDDIHGDLGRSNTLDVQAVIVVKFKLNKKVPDAASKKRQWKSHSNAINLISAEPAVLRAVFDEDSNSGQILFEVSLSEDVMISISVYDKVPW
jgi:hypothetical protein